MQSNILMVAAVAAAGGVFSLAGGAALLFSKKSALSLSRLAVPFAGGSLLGAVFLDLLQEANEHGQIEVALKFTLGGILLFFVLEKVMGWLHHHHSEEEDTVHQDARIPMIVAGDTMHNLIDGFVIGASFLINPISGLITSLVVAVHEIPQEVGDFGLLLSKGMGRKKVLLVNLFSALASATGAVLFFQFGELLSLSLGPVLGLTSGFFIYIALSDIVPEIHKEEANPKKRQLITHGTLLMAAGALFVGTMATLLHAALDRYTH